MRQTLIASFIVALAACGGSGGGESPVPMVQVGGMLAGLGAGKSVVVADASGPSSSLSANGRYSLNLPAGTAYNLRIQAQPAGQTCAVANGTGTATADVNNITVTCTDNLISPEARTVGGTVAGLGAGKAVVLQLNAQDGMQETTVQADGSFSFAQPVVGSYTITVRTAPAGQACTVATGGAITVTCAAAASGFRLGGTVTGNAGVVAIRNAANGDTITLNTNGAFTFAQPVLLGGGYSVLVVDQSAGQTCSVTGGSGTANADVGRIVVSCAAVVAVAPPAPPPAAVPAVPTGLTMTYGLKSFNLAWGTVTAPAGGGSVTYRVFEDADGAGPAAGAHVGGAVSGATYTHAVTALLHTRLNAEYRVQACNSGGCSSPTAAVTPFLTPAIGYLKASNAGPGRFGNAVALSSDGSTLAVGAPLEGNSATGINGNQASGTAAQSGAVYVFVRTGGVWSQQAYVKASNAQAGDQFGESVALSADGSTLAVGAWGEDSAATGVNGNESDNSATESGAAYVFSRSAGSWSQQAYVKAGNTGAGDQFGWSLSLAADGNTLAVGARFEQSAAPLAGGSPSDNSADRAGAAYVFTRSAGAWSQQAFVKAANAQADDWFGSSVALSGDGGTLAVGSYYEDGGVGGINGNAADNGTADSGAVYVFIRGSGAWSQQAYVKADAPFVNSTFGASVALSANGNVLAVGATGWTSDAGFVYAFARTGSTWAQQARLQPGSLGAFTQFGSSVSLSADGNTLAAGAHFQTANGTGISSPTTGTVLGSGAAYVYARSAGSWSQQAYLKASNTGRADTFGQSIALSADAATLAVGAYLEASNAVGIGGDQGDDSITGRGAVYLY